MLEIASLTVSISKLRHYTSFSDRPPLSQYPGSAPARNLDTQTIKNLTTLSQLLGLNIDHC